jgi:hypothetical protein
VRLTRRVNREQLTELWFRHRNDEVTSWLMRSWKATHVAGPARKSVRRALSVSHPRPTMLFDQADMHGILDEEEKQREQGGSLRSRKTSSARWTNTAHRPWTATTSKSWVTSSARHGSSTSGLR